MELSGFILTTLGALVVLALLYFGIELMGRAAARKHRNAARVALDKYWEENKDQLRQHLPCPNCEMRFDAPDTTYFECPHCGYLLTREWVKNYHHRKLKEEWENSFSGRYYRISPEVRSKP